MIEYENHYIIVVINYFSKWSKARLLRHANATLVAMFIYKEIICRYRLPVVTRYSFY